MKSPRRRLFHQRQQHLCQQKVAQVIDPQLRVKAVLRLPGAGGPRGNATAVDQEVDLLLLLQEPLGAFAHRPQRGQVQLFGLDGINCQIRKKVDSIDPGLNPGLDLLTISF
jgi:hypothetical protein